MTDQKRKPRGRPKNPERDTKEYGKSLVWFSAREHEMMNIICEREERTRSEIVREAVRQHCEHYFMEHAQIMQVLSKYFEPKEK